MYTSVLTSQNISAVSMAVDLANCTSAIEYSYGNSLNTAS